MNLTLISIVSDILLLPLLIPNAKEAELGLKEIESVTINFSDLKKTMDLKLISVVFNISLQLGGLSYSHYIVFQIVIHRCTRCG